MPGPILATDGHDDAAYHSMLRPALEVSRAAAPHLTADGKGRLVFMTARSVVEATPELALSSVFRSGVAAAGAFASARARPTGDRQRRRHGSVRHAGTRPVRVAAGEP